MVSTNPPRRRGRPRKVKSIGDMTLDERIKKYTPYLSEIHNKIISTLIVFSAVTIIGMINYQHILGAIMHLFDLQGINIVLTSPYQFWNLAINTGVTIGFVVVFPLIIYHLLSFLRPAMEPGEYRQITRLIPASAILFIIGFVFGVWIVQFIIELYTKTTLNFSVGNLWDIGHFFSQIILMGLILGIAFQLPVIMTLLMRFNLVKRETFITYRRYFYAAIVIIATFAPPTDIISLSLLTIPPVFLFEIAIILNHPLRLKYDIDGKAGNVTLE